MWALPNSNEQIHWKTFSRVEFLQRKRENGTNIDHKGIPHTRRLHNGFVKVLKIDKAYLGWYKWRRSFLAL